MKKITPVLLLLLYLIKGILIAETHHYYLGSIQLAGMVPESLAHAGSTLRFLSIDQALMAEDQSEQGYIPRKFRAPILSMHQAGLDLHFEVRHLFASPLPGKFIQVDVWATTDKPDKIIPLIFSIPIMENESLTAQND